ncbi:hypothetical protein FIBSPDRAFT_769362 [Athelia psychrophila]|uniref:CCD97-like C-terminal domain-containing protein n=1 Tax=Athelia psychrophila TaxID=1759441 RepID=A0A167TPV1_9AGAM|nr:hypothetical protein FIBSPDRAFT_769362 [Fibularhizoctonia sp. CBS 109695]
MTSWTPSEAPVFKNPPILSYLQLPETYTPSPASEPIDFLHRHIRHLPPHLLLTFSLITEPKQRTIIPTIRNRRLKYTRATPAPPEFEFLEARNRWPGLWGGRERRGVEEGAEESSWANDQFLQGAKGHVGKLATLLGEYEQEREAERIRTIRRERAANAAFIPEEDSDSDDDEEPCQSSAQASNLKDEDASEAKATFERLVKERFIYGLLEDVDYNAVDWEDQFDADDDREAEERWFDDDSD